MDKEKLRDLYCQRSSDEMEIEKAIKTVEKLENYLKKKYNRDMTSAEIIDIKGYIEYLTSEEENTLDRILAMARYFYLIKKNDIYIYFTTILGGLSVIENIRKRSQEYCGSEMTVKIFGNLPEVPLGSPLTEYPVFTMKLMDNLESELPKEIYRKVLTGNNHNIPKESFAKEHELFLKSNDIDTYLKELHGRKVAELQKHCDEDIVWFEQRISQKVVDFVKENQEILSAKRIGNKLYVTKIPYDIESFLNEPDPEKKKYHACHCPFVRKSLLKKENGEEVKVNDNWCYCSAGFTKHIYDNILGKDLKIKLMNSPLKGDDLCRFKLEME